MYLNKRLVDFEARLQAPVLQAGQGQGPGAPKRSPGSLVQEACNRLYHRYQNRRHTRGPKPRLPQEPTTTEKAAITVDNWVTKYQKDQGQVTVEEVLAKEWENRWKRQVEGRPRRIADEGSPDQLFTAKTLQKHQDLTKAQSSLLVQARTGSIGFRDFLFKQNVPIPTPYCSCGEGRETVEHLVIWCPIPPKPRTWPTREIRTHRDLSLVLRGEGSWNLWLLKKVLGWLMGSGRLVEYKLARRLELEAGEEDIEEEEDIGG